MSNIKYKRKKHILFVIFVLAFVFTFVNKTYTEVPHYINFQGTLIDTTQTPNVPVNGEKNITFMLYDNESSPTPVWQATITTHVNNGLVNILLGDNSMFDEFNGENKWITMKIEPSGQESNRQKIVSVPYAAYAGNSDKIDGYHAGNASGSIPVNNDSLNTDLYSEYSQKMKDSNNQAHTMGEGAN